VQVTPAKQLTESKLTILVAEDDETNYRYLEILIGKIYPNCIILHATDGAQAIEKCGAVPEIELVLMDIKLPVVDGYEAIRQIRKFRHHLPIIAQSAYSKVADINKAKDAGCDDYITKPISLEELHKLLEKYLPVERKSLYGFNPEL
jgi:CheY-like chemotaxis protein